jgi:hypothetical protein
MPAPAPSTRAAATQQERRRQIRGSLYLAAAVLIFSLLRAHHVFNPGWWRLW